MISFLKYDPNILDWKRYIYIYIYCDFVSCLISPYCIIQIKLLEVNLQYNSKNFHNINKQNRMIG